MLFRTLIKWLGIVSSICMYKIFLCIWCLLYLYRKTPTLIKELSIMISLREEGCMAGSPLS